MTCARLPLAAILLAACSNTPCEPVTRDAYYRAEVPCALAEEPVLPCHDAFFVEAGQCKPRGRVLAEWSRP